MRYVLFPKALDSNQRKFITTKVPFYNSLSKKDKIYFEHRILKFIRHHEFVSRENFVITEEIKLLITSVAIKLTFGYPRYLFSRIDTIIIYPRDYFSQIGQQYHKGETNPRYKTIVFSWKDFEEGINITDDNLNLGLHEFTHAMHFSFSSESSFSSNYFKEHYQKLLSFLEDENEQRKLIDTGYLRAYAFENQYEFLAVLVEHFFETPQKFKKHLPEVYSYVRKILNAS